MTIERRLPHELPADPDITADLRKADETARQQFVERGAELLERLRRL